MLFALEEEFGVTVPEDKTESIVTVQDIVDIIDSAK
jgi:acyl carrier protein